MLPASKEGFICSSEFDHPLRFRLRHCEQEEQTSGVCEDLSPSAGEERNYTNNAKAVRRREAMKETKKHSSPQYLTLVRWRENVLKITASTMNSAFIAQKQ